MKKTFFILILLIVSCKSPNNKISESKSAELEQFRIKVESIFNESIDPNELGLAILITYDGKMLLGKGYGVRDLETKEPITKSTNLEIVSVNKQLTALAIMPLIKS